jgi:hypothetical protein
MNIDAFAEKHRFKTRLDECGDKIIPGKRGHLYIAGGELCLMVTDGRVSTPERWKELSARSLWLGEISRDAKGVRVQDVKVVGIPEEKWKLAVRLARVRQRRVASEAQLEGARKGREALRRRNAADNCRQEHQPTNEVHVEGMKSTCCDAERWCADERSAAKPAAHRAAKRGLLPRLAACQLSESFSAVCSQKLE